MVGAAAAPPGLFLNGSHMYAWVTNNGIWVELRVGLMKIELPSSDCLPSKLEIVL